MSLKTVRYGLWGAVAIAVGALGGHFYVTEFKTDPIKEQVSGVAAIGGPFDLVDHNGAQITQAAFEGSPSVVFFGFTHCPEICPTTLADISGWLDEAGEDAKNVKGYFVTVDPERDTAEAMKDYVSTFSDRITGVTGTPENIQQMLRNYKVFAQKVRLGNGDYTMDHTASVILLDDKGEFVSTIAYGEVPSVAVDKLKLLAKRNVS